MSTEPRNNDAISFMKQERKVLMADDVLAPRPVRDSQSEMAEIVLPNDANPLAALLG